MNTQTPLEKDVEQAKREFVLNFIRRRNLIKSNENIILSEKVFVINAVLRWCLDKIKSKQLSENQWKKNQTAIARFIAGIVDIEWRDDCFEVIELENE
jgi:CRISPR/Cas system-associated protein Cas10 (large subunit of type III CRISPR-Cas system)